MKKALTSILFITIVLFLYSCYDNTLVDESEEDSYYAVRVGTIDGDTFKEDEGYIHDKQFFVDKDAKKQKVFNFNERALNLEYVNSDNYVHNERQRYRLNMPDEEFEAKFFTESGELAWLNMSKPLADAPDVLRSESEFREWTEHFLKKLGITDMSGYTINYKTFFVYSVPGKTSGKSVDGFYIPEADSNETVSHYCIIYTYAIDGVDTSDRYEFLFNTEKDGKITVFFPNGSFNEFENCPLDIDKADKALACEYVIEAKFTRDDRDESHTTLLTVAVFPNAPKNP